MERHGIGELRRLMERLRDPSTGCPWDLMQDFRSLVRHTIEETYELVDAIERDDQRAIRDELGDYLFQAVFYAQIASERGLFDFDDVSHGIVTKLLRRHPHVFPDGTLSSRRDLAAAPPTDAIRETWERIKQSDRAARAEHSALDDVPLALPALARAEKLQRRASREGFDWTAWEGVMEKLAEETAELREAARSGGAAAREEELGDLLFTCVNLARHLDVDAETALRRASAKFERRFRIVEELARERGLPLEGCDAATQDLLWREAKSRGPAG